MIFPTSINRAHSPTTTASTTGFPTESSAVSPTGFRVESQAESRAGSSSGSEAESWNGVTQPAARITRITNHGRARASTDACHPARRQSVNLLMVALVTLAAASNLIDVYGSPAAWAAAAVPATIIGCLVALSGTIKPLRFWWQTLFMALAQLVAGPVLLLNETTIAHVIPTLRTLTQGCTAMLGSFKYVISISPPVGTANGSLLAVWTICLWSALLTGMFAVSRNGRFATIAIIPVMVSIALCALLGTADGYHRPIFGTFTAIVLVVWISVRWNSLESERWLSCAIIMALSVSLAVGACLTVGQNRTILRDHYDPPPISYDYASPLSGMRSYIKDHKDSTLLTVTGLPAGSAVRLAVMDCFDGNVWNLAGRATNSTSSISASSATASSDSSNYHRVGTTIIDGIEGEEFEATFTIHEGFNEYWLPLAGHATSVRFDHTDDADSFYYNTSTKSAIYASTTNAGLTYTETGIMPAMPTEEQIRKAEAASTSQPQTQDVPESVEKLAVAIAGGEATGGAAALALADTLRESGWFSHGLVGNYPSAAGHGNYRLNQLLAGTAMVGDSEQYASAMALMARSLGLSSRVVLGFLPKNEDGSASRERTEPFADTTIVEFTGNDVAAWVEIKLDGYGWVSFHPTPKETKIPDDDQNLAPPNPQTLVRQPPLPLADPLHDDNQAKGKTSIGGSTADEIPDDMFERRFGHIVKMVIVCTSPIWVPFIICLLILGIKAATLARARRHGDARQRVVAGWWSISALAEQSGVAVDGTRRNQARIISRQLNVDSATLLALCDKADYAVFSGNAVRESHVRRYWRSIDAAREAMLDSLPPARRWKARLSLAGMVRLSTRHSGQHSSCPASYEKRPAPISRKIRASPYDSGRFTGQGLADQRVSPRSIWPPLSSRKSSGLKSSPSFRSPKSMLEKSTSDRSASKDASAASPPKPKFG